jgi:ERCC4-related helicase
MEILVQDAISVLAPFTTSTELLLSIRAKAAQRGLQTDVVHYLKQYWLSEDKVNRMQVFGQARSQACLLLEQVLAGLASYDWREKDSKSKQKQIKAVEDAFWDHKRRYGSRRLVVELETLNEPMGRHRVRSLMQQQGLKAIQPRSFVPRTTDSRHGKRVSGNLLLNQPLPLAPNQVEIWTCDRGCASGSTYLPLVNSKWGYLATWMDWT